MRLHCGAFYLGRELAFGYPRSPACQNPRYYLWYFFPLAKVPLINFYYAEHGGMSEFVKHEINGLTFQHRSEDALAQCLQRAVDNPLALENLGKRGYIKSENGCIRKSFHAYFLVFFKINLDIPSIEQHVGELLAVYRSLPAASTSSTLASHALSSTTPPLTHNTAPWRITFDTNPDDCNLRCIMCEEHSIYSTSQAERKAGMSFF